VSTPKSQKWTLPVGLIVNHPQIVGADLCVCPIHMICGREWNGRAVHVPTMRPMVAFMNGRFASVGADT